MLVQTASNNCLEPGRTAMLGSMRCSSKFVHLCVQQQPCDCALCGNHPVVCRAKRDLSAFADGLITALGGSKQQQGGSSGSSSSSYRHLLAGFATFMPSKDQQWFRDVVGSGVTLAGHKRAGGSSKDTEGNKAPPAAGAAAAAAQGRSKGPSTAAGSGAAGRSGTSTGHPAKKQRVHSAAGDASRSAAGAGAAAAGTNSSKQQQGSKQPLQQTAKQPGAQRQQQQGPGRPEAQKQPHQKQQQQNRQGQAQQSSQGQLSSVRQPLPGSAAALSKGSSAGKLPPAGTPPKPCLVCKKAPMASAYKAACGHLACYTCWLDLLSTNLRGVNCPTCGKLVRKAQLAAVPFA
jgi:hypothetical protein